MISEEDREKILVTTCTQFRQSKRIERIWRNQVTVDDYGLVSVDGSAEWVKKGPRLPIRFKKVADRFSVQNRNLKTLQGSPQTCQYFYCQANKLTTLEGCPQTVGSGFNCASNQLESLEGSPKTFQNPRNWFICNKNQLIDLRGAPEDCHTFECMSNPLQSLVGLPKICQHFSMDYDPALGMLRLLMVDGLQGISLRTPNGGHHPVVDIITKHLGQGRDAIVPCAAELHKAGFGGNAKL